METSRWQYRQCTAAGACKGGRDWSSYDSSESERDDPWRPAFVTIGEADAYCAWRGKRLATDAEWQKAARGTDDRMFPWGDRYPDCDRAWTEPAAGSLGLSLNPRKCKPLDLRRVGQLRAGSSPYGVLDLYDNAPEWIQDWNDKEPIGMISDELPGERVGSPTLRFSRTTSDAHTILNYDWLSARGRWVIHDSSIQAPRWRRVLLHPPVGRHGRTRREATSSPALRNFTPAT